MANIDSLSIQISASTKNAKDKIDALVESLDKLVTAINSIDTSKIESLASSVDKLGSAMTSLKGTSAKSITKYAEALNNVSDAGKTAFEPIVQGEAKVAEKTEALADNAEKVNTNLKAMDKTSLDQVADSAEKAASSLGSALTRVTSVKAGFRHIVVPTKSFKNLENQINRVADKYNALQERMKKGLSSGDLSADDDKYMKMSAQLDALRNKYDELILKQKELAMEGSAIRLNPGVEAALGGFKSGFSAVSSIIKFGFVAGIKMANTSLKPFRLLLDKATGAASRFAKGVHRITKMLKLMVTRMALRKVIEEVGNGFKSLALHSEEFNQSVSSMMNGSKKLGYSFAAMVSPIINALAPAIVYLINLFVKLANVMNQVFSALTGSKTWNRAKDFTENWADNIEAANKSAKQLKKTVLGFDELNQLQEKYTPGGDTSNNIVDMFETEEIDKKWQNWVDKLKKMWKDANFTELGADLGKALKDALDSIPWDKIKEGARQVGASLATLLNGFEEVEGLGYSIGKTFAEGLNTVFEAIDSFVTNKHWASTGHFIADTLNGWFENIDWPLIQHTFEEGFRGLAIAIGQFVMDFRWDNISDFIGNFVDTFTGAIKAFFTTKLYDDRGFQLNYSPMYKIGYEIAYQLSRSIAQIDWVQFGEALGALVQGLIDAIKGAIDGLSAKGWEPVKTAIQDGFTGMAKTLDFGDAAMVIGGVLVGALTLKVGKWGLGKLGGKIVAAITGGSAAAKVSETAGSMGKVATAAGEATAAVGELTYSIGELTGASNGLMGAGALGAIAETYKHGEKIKETSELLSENADKIKELDEAYQNGKIGIVEWSREMDKLTNPEKTSILGETIDNWVKSSGMFRDSMTLTADQFEDMGKRAGLSSEEIDKWSKRFEEADPKVKNTSDTIKKTSESARNLGHDFGTVVTPLGNLSETAGKFQGSLDKVDESTKKVTQNTPILTEKQKALTDAFNNTAKVEPTFTASQKKIEDALKGVQTETDNLGTTTALVWEQFGTDTANAELSFAGTAGQISADMDGLEIGLTAAVKEIGKAFSKDNWTFSGVWEGLENTFSKAIEGIKKLWNKFVNSADEEGEIAGGKFKIKLPHFAYGGFPEEDGLFYANHTELVGTFSNGKTAVANNAEIVEGIRAGVYDAVTAAMANNTSGNSDYISNTIILDGEVIARSVTRAQNKQNMRFSPQTI